MALDTLNAASFLELSKRPRARRGGGYVHDICIALRQPAGTPVVTIVAVLPLALGIGANTAIFRGPLRVLSLFFPNAVDRRTLARAKAVVRP